MKAAFIAHRDNAKRRGKEYTLTFDDFCKFAIESTYYVNKGRSAISLHIDRVNETKGYTVDNIQVLSNQENVRKYVRFKERYQGKITFETVTVKNKTYPNCPF